MPPLSTVDPEILEQTLVAAIRDVFNTVPIVASYVKVEMRERFPPDDKEDILVSTVPDFVQPDIPYTSIIQIGLPTVTEKPYTSETYTQLTFVYPITFDAGVRDSWASGPYPNSRTFGMAVYMQSRKQFKLNLTLNYDNCQHEYLQQESAITAEDEETGGRLHAFDWSLTVHVKGVNA